MTRAELVELRREALGRQGRLSAQAALCFSGRELELVEAWLDDAFRAGYLAASVGADLDVLDSGGGVGA